MVHKIIGGLGSRLPIHRITTDLNDVINIENEEEPVMMDATGSPNINVSSLLKASPEITEYYNDRSEL